MDGERSLFGSNTIWNTTASFKLTFIYSEVRAVSSRTASWCLSAFEKEEEGFGARQVSSVF